MNTLRQDRSEFNCIFVHSELDDLGLDAQEFRIYAHLARRANGRTKAWPGLSSMTKACRMNRHTVIRAIRGLEERNLIAVRRKTGGLSEYVLTAPSKWKRTSPTGAFPGTGEAGGTGAQGGTGAYASTGARMGTGVVSKEARVPVPREALKGNPREGNPEKVLNTVGGGSRGPTASRPQRVGDGGRPASGPSAMNGQARSPSTPRQESRKTARSQTSLRRKAFAVASRLESLHWDNCKVAYALHAA
ncbi:MAG: helix-turn-helix domain-containing protein, partial [Verrucomicrobiae bacterium]|nr:helix-turn-helix domain-containing protein [Verrucomicrobiae bacterium]